MNWVRNTIRTGVPGKDPESSEEEKSAVPWRINDWFPQLSDQVRSQLKDFHGMLLEGMKSANLISVKTIATADLIHFSDSILAAKSIFESHTVDEIYDFGSGGGLPGVIFAILHPGIKFHMVESDPKKADFIRGCAKQLNLSHADVLTRAVEALPPGSVRFGVSRDLSTISKTLMVTRKLFKKGGRYFHLKGEEWASEIASIPTQLCSHWSPSLVGEYCLPIGEAKHAVVKTEKMLD